MTPIAVPNRLFERLITTVGEHTNNRLPTGFRVEDTPSHGYYYISAQRQETIPASIRMDRYEEDADWSIPFFFNRSLFTQLIQQHAIETFADWHWQAFENVTGLMLLSGESYLKDRHTDAQANTGREYVVVAFGDGRQGVPRGMVYVETRLRGVRIEERQVGHVENKGNSYLIDSSSYAGKCNKAGDTWIDDDFQLVNPEEANGLQMTIRMSKLPNI